MYAAFISGWFDLSGGPVTKFEPVFNDEAALNFTFFSGKVIKLVYLKYVSGYQ